MNRREFNRIAMATPLLGLATLEAKAKENKWPYQWAPEKFGYNCIGYSSCPVINFNEIDEVEIINYEKTKCDKYGWTYRRTVECGISIKPCPDVYFQQEFVMKAVLDRAGYLHVEHLAINGSTANGLPRNCEEELRKFYRDENGIKHFKTIFKDWHVYQYNSDGECEKLLTKHCYLKPLHGNGIHERPEFNQH